MSAVNRTNSEPEHEMLCGCGLPMSRNPHPDAGTPSAKLLEVGAAYVCIPCTTDTRHRWATRAMKAEGMNVRWREGLLSLRDCPACGAQWEPGDHAPDCPFVEVRRG